MKKSILVFAGLAAVWLAFQSWPSANPAATNTAVQPVGPDRAGVVSVSEDLPPVEVSAEGARATQRDFQRMVAFAKWTDRWMAAAEEVRAGMVAEGRRLAEARRPAFKNFIIRDPQRALENAVPRVVRQTLPEEITKALEVPLSAEGNYRVYFGKPMPGVALPADTELTMRYFETPDGASYKARVFGEMIPVLSNPNLPLRGVAVDREFAVAENPVRRLEVGEIIPADSVVSNTCPVSGKTTKETVANAEPVTAETAVVEVAGRLITLCDGSHVTVLENSYREASGAGGAGAFKDTYPGTSSTAIGNFRCLYIRVTYTDQLKAPNTEASGYSDMKNVAKYYLDSSFGRMSETATVTPLIVLPHSQAWYIAKDSEVDGLGLVHSDARSEAKKLGYDSGQYTCTIVRVNGGPRLSGISWGGGSSVWVSWDGMDVLNHECGHSLGRNHANYWATNDGTAIGNGANEEYGNSFDVMGGGGGYGAHYNTISKRALGWLSDSYVYRPVANAAANGNYRVVAYDQPTLEEGKRYALRVAKDSAREYYLEYHPAAGGLLKDSALLLFKWSGMSNAGHLIDTTPGSAGGKSDGGIQIGRTFSDAEADLHFTVLSKNATVPPSLDVSMQRGPFPGNQPPTVRVNASATAVAVGANITFTATGSDPDGDPLSYYWDFNDGVASENSATLTRNFPATDQMTVMVTASDMKGGIARAHVVVTIGSPGRSVLTGRVMLGAQPLMGVYIKSDKGKYCYTDSSGNYALCDLTQASHSFTATLAGYSFTAGFTNPFTPATGTTPGKDWTAVSIPELTMTATADATEVGVNGSFVLARTGDTTSALDVHVASPTGNATIATDYTLSPAYTDDGVFKKFTIPAGSSSLTVNVVPVNDAAAEGPETVTLQYAANPGYIVRRLGSATVALADNDTALPQVALTVPDPNASETPGDGGAFLLSRTGSTDAPLTVTLAYTGTATRGTDYPSLPTSFVIPAGAATASLALVPTDDLAIEIPEDVIVTISANAAYVIASGANTATATIIDNDTPVVTISALDAVASEAGRKPAVLLISRTGSTAAALKVYYGMAGSALHGTDYVSLPGELTLPAGVASAPLLITPYDDNFGEPTETVTINLTTFGDAYSLAPAYSASINLLDNNDPPLVNVTAGTSAAEPSTSGNFIVRTMGSSSAPVTVRYAVSGTATSGVDFTALSGTVTLPGDGSASATVTIPILNDALPEDTEKVIITLLPDPSYVIYNDGTAIVRIKDDEAGAVAVSTHSTTPAEPGTTSSFYLSRTNSTGDLTVNYTISGTATNGTDYASLSGSVVIPDGQTGVDVIVTPTNDTLVEGTETIILTLDSSASYGIEVPSGTLYLTDDETNPATVGFSSATGTTTEALDPTLGEYREVTVVLSAAQAGTVTVEYSGGGGTATGDDVDWALVDATNAIIPRGVLTFSAGETSKKIRLRVKNDAVQEGAETAILQLRNPYRAALTSGKNLHTLTINDANDLSPRVQFLLASSTVAEVDGKEPLLMAVLDKAPTAAVNVNYAVTGGTATAGTDYTLTPGTITFAAGETFKLIPLTIVVDAVAELAETIAVSLSAPTGAVLGTPTTHTITVKETNISNLSVTASTSEAVEGGQAGAFTITRVGGSLALALTVNYTLGGTATNGTDFTALSGAVVLGVGQASVNLPVQPIDDDQTEALETVILSLTANANYNLDAASDATVNLLDNDAPPVITIISPTTDTVSLPLGVGLMVHAESTGTTPNGVTQVPVSWSMVSGPAAAGFESAAANQTGVTFPTAGTYVLRVSSGNPTGLSTTDLTVFYDAPALVGQDIGAVAGTTTAGSSTNAAGSYTLRASGSGLSGSGTSDGFYFLSLPITGNFDFKVRVASILNPGASGSCRFGLMARASNAANALYAYSCYKGDLNHAYQYRTVVGAAPGASTGTSASYTMPRWVRLTRTGDVFAAYLSPDGTTWTQRGANQTIAMGASPLVGFALTSAVQASLSTAVFDSANLPLASNVGPFVNAGNALSGGSPWNLDATITDDRQPLPAALSHHWTTWSGPGAATFVSSAATDTGVTFPVTGLYTLRLTASDGAITTFDDTTVNATVPVPIETWRTAKFTTAAGNPAISGDLADPDHDGINNLLEYALNLDPNAPSTQLPTLAVEGNVISLTYRKHLDATDVVMEVEDSSDLSDWAPVAVTETILGTNARTQTIKASLPMDGPRQFLHLKVTYGGTIPPQP